MTFSHPRPIPRSPADTTIGIFSPSGAVDEARLARSVATMEASGYRVVVAQEATRQWRYFAGADEVRLASFHQMLADPAIDVMMISRGGYGWSRLLHRIDWQAVAAAQKPICGFSDFTAFNLAALSQAGLVTYAGPGVATDFDLGDATTKNPDDHAFMEAHCWPLLRGEAVVAGPFDSAHGYALQSLQGPIWGSNLSMLTHLVGTPYLPAIEGGILFVEEIAEQPYAIERLFFQLFHAGILQRQKALLLGDFTDCEPAAGRFPYAMAHVVETLRELLPYPVLTGLPFGHVPRKLTIPYGAVATLSIAAGGYSLQL